MGLVDYGSDSDSDSPPQSTAPAPAPVPPTRSKRRILLDLPAPSATTPNAQAGPSSSKRFKSSDTAAGDPSPPLTGLAAMLPKPKNSSSAPSAPVAPPKVAAKGPSRLEVLLAGADKATRANEAAMLLPPAVAAKRKQEQAPAAPPAADFFGISSVASSSSSSGPATSTSSSSSSKPSLSSSSSSFSAAPSISSAPPPAPKSQSQPSSSSADDPYPGFTQLPSGEWVAKDQKTYEMWMAWQAQQQAQGGLAAEAEHGLDEKDLKARGGLVDVKQQQSADEAAVGPGGGRAEGHKPAAAVKGIPSQLSGSAKRKHQLSSLLAAAHDNRAELEDRIAQARQNRRSGANKYGF
ncbi:hypothetical protein B0A53_05682 [Rhodotorula sp. CCFEE 5036]|nr:hypothetical protein B0A53_05682 [Rhodotorula sp. CCFEE 5036]